MSEYRPIEDSEELAVGIKVVQGLVKTNTDSVEIIKRNKKDIIEELYEPI